MPNYRETGKKLEVVGPPEQHFEAKVARRLTLDAKPGGKPYGTI